MIEQLPTTLTRTITWDQGAEMAEHATFTVASAKGRTAEDAARLVGWSRATLYRHQQADAARESAAM